MINKAALVVGLCAIVLTVTSISNDTIPAGAYHNAVSYEEIKNVMVSPNSSGILMAVLFITLSSILLLLFLRSNKNK